MSKNGLVLLVVVVACVILVKASYIVSETEQVIITQLGEPIGVAVTEPGLHFLKPFSTFQYDCEVKNDRFLYL